MRKVFLSAMVFASVMAFTSCNNEEIIVVEGGNGTEIVDEVLKADEAIFEFGVTNTGVGTSRVGRPVGSSAAANNVNKVKLDVFKRNDANGSWELDNSVKISKGYAGVTYSGMVINWTAGPNGEGTSTTDRYGMQKVKLSGIKKGVTYKFVATGYNNENPYGTPKQDEYMDAIYQTTAKPEGYAIEEIFAGQEWLTAVPAGEEGEEGAFDKYISIILERQVAGTLAYFENVPSKINETKVTHVLVKANKKSTGFFYPTTQAFNGLKDGMVDEQDVLFTFDLSKIATNYTTANGAAYTFEDWTNGKPANSKQAPVAEGYTVPAGLKLKAGSMFGGRFVLPYSNHYAEQTLTVEMVHISKGKTTVLKSLNVTTDQVPEIGTKNAYDIRRNNFYSIGKKLKTDSTEPVDPTDPTDPDKPIDLTKNTDITVIINDAWDVLHDMGVEDGDI